MLARDRDVGSSRPWGSDDLADRHVGAAPRRADADHPRVPRRRRRPAHRRRPPHPAPHRRLVVEPAVGRARRRARHRPGVPPRRALRAPARAGSPACRPLRLRRPQSERAYGADLRRRRPPRRLRADRALGSATSPTTTSARRRERASPRTSARAAAEGAGSSPAPSSVAIARYSDNRVYDLSQADGPRLDVVVLDGDRQVIGVLTRFWRSLRLRGIDGRSVVSLRQAAERAALLAYAAQAAGVRTPRLLGVAEADDSMLLVQEHARRHRAAARPRPTEAHRRLLRERSGRSSSSRTPPGRAPRPDTSTSCSSATPDGAEPAVWLTGWESGDVASSTLARRMDLTQIIALLALRVGAERALASAAEVLPDEDIAALGPLLQTSRCPARTREEIREHKEVITELRAALVERLPEADVEPEQPRPVRRADHHHARAHGRRGVRRADDHQLRGDQRGRARRATAVGPRRLRARPAHLPRGGAWRSSRSRRSSSRCCGRPPCRRRRPSSRSPPRPGIGPAALNLRMLTKRGVTTSLALATVALVQVSQFVVTLSCCSCSPSRSGDGGVLPRPPVAHHARRRRDRRRRRRVGLPGPVGRRWIARRRCRCTARCGRACRRCSGSRGACRSASPGTSS